MKKPLLSFFALTIGTISFAQQIPNGGFKTFTGAVPVGWIADTGVAFSGKAVGEQRIKVKPGIGADSTADDSTSVYVTAQRQGGVVYPGVIALGTATVVGTKSGVKGAGFPATVRPVTLSGFAKYKSTTPNHGGIAVLVSHWTGAKRDTLGGYINSVFTIDTTSTWEGFNIPITYNPLYSGVVPDSILVIIISSNEYNNEAPTLGDTLWVDNLRFLSCAPDASVQLGTTIVQSPSTTIAVNNGSYSINQTFTIGLPYASFTHTISDSVTYQEGLKIPVVINRLDSITLDSITPLQTGLMYTCGTPNCVFYGNSIGCYVVSGELPAIENYRYTDTIYTTVSGNSASLQGLIPSGELSAMGVQSTPLVFIVGFPPTPPTGIELVDANQFCLLQNAPNPFNGITTIKFITPVAATIQFTVVNILGTVVNTQTINALVGLNTITFFAGSIDAGAYFYSISDGILTATNKLIVYK